MEKGWDGLTYADGTPVSDLAAEVYQVAHLMPTPAKVVTETTWRGSTVQAWWRLERKSLPPLKRFHTVMARWHRSPLGTTYTVHYDVGGDHLGLAGSGSRYPVGQEPIIARATGEREMAYLISLLVGEK